MSVVYYTIAVIAVLATIGGLILLFGRQSRKRGADAVNLEVLESANAKLKHNAKIDAKPMDVDDADASARRLARKLRKD